MRRIGTNRFGAPVKAEETTGKVASVTQSSLVFSRVGSNTCTVRVKWIKGEEEWEESFQWGDLYGYPLELVL